MTGQAFPDTLVGTDSHTTMINGLGVLGWGVGGIEAEAAMLGQPVSMLIPQVVGFKLTGELPEGATATDLVLTVTQMLRERGVVGKFVEFYGDGPRRACRSPTARRSATWRPSTARPAASSRSTPRRCATSSSPAARRSCVALVEAYCKEQGMFRDESPEEPTFSDTLELDLGGRGAEPRRAAKRPQDRVALTEAKTSSATRSPSSCPAATDPEPRVRERDAGRGVAESFPASDPPAAMAGERVLDGAPQPAARAGSVAVESALERSSSRRSRTAPRPSSTTATS